MEVVLSYEGDKKSATQYSDTMHYSMDMTNGHGATNAETNQSYVAVQVIL
ncbi:MAG: hypothetical protein ABXS91_04300 [Sulfurimonas sp.]